MDTNTHKSNEESLHGEINQVVPPPYLGSERNNVPTTNAGAFDVAPQNGLDSKQGNKDWATGCSYGISAILILGAIVCFLFDHPIWGSILAFFGICWIVTNINDAKIQKKRQEEEMYKQQCIDDVFCSNVINAIKNKLPLDGMVSVFMTKNPDEQKYNLEKIFTEIINTSMEDGIITDEEENGINRFISHFKIDISSISTKSVEDKQMQEIYKKHNIKVPDNINTLYDKYVKLLVIKDLLNGILPHRKNVECGGYYLNLDKDEQIIWDFSSCSYFQEVTTTTYVSKHSGGSMRIAKGIYMRSGSTKTTPIKETEMKEKATGTLFIGTKNLYFYSATKTVKIPYKKVVSFTPYSDGLGLQKDGDNSKPQAFKGIDGWFAYNVVTNIQNLEA